MEEQGAAALARPSPIVGNWNLLRCVRVLVFACLDVVGRVDIMEKDVATVHVRDRRNRVRILRTRQTNSLIAIPRPTGPELIFRIDTKSLAA
jgi:hypothetical protein